MGLKARSATGKFRVRTREYANMVMDLRRAGASYVEISASLKTRNPPVVLSPQRCHAIVKAVLAEMSERLADQADDLRAIEFQRLDAILLALWESRSDPRTADTILRIVERRAKMAGIDAPIRTETSGPGGGPVAYDLSAMTTEEVRQLIALYEKMIPATPEVGALEAGDEEDAEGGGDPDPVPV